MPFQHKEMFYLKHKVVFFLQFFVPELIGQHEVFQVTDQ
jgi:hypothetical protein